MTKNRPLTPRPSQTPADTARTDIDTFLERVAGVGGGGRLVVALDATLSRQPSWDLACELQADMFDAAAGVGGLSVQLVYFRGLGECRASNWVGNARALRDLMVRIDCRGGRTQIRKVLAHVRRELAKRPVAALVYVGDAMEENPDELCHLAGELGLHGVRAFMFHEGRDQVAERTFREIARLTGGAYLPFDRAAAEQLRALLAAVGTYAAGGLRALLADKGEGARLLLPHLGK